VAVRLSTGAHSPASATALPRRPRPASAATAAAAGGSATTRKSAAITADQLPSHIWSAARTSRSTAIRPPATGSAAQAQPAVPTGCPDRRRRNRLASSVPINAASPAWIAYQPNAKNASEVGV
jgi:hypothetical protein